VSRVGSNATGHTNAEMVYRRYRRFIPNLRGQDGALAAKGLAHEGLRGQPWSLDGHSTQPRGYGSPRNPLSFWSGRPDSNRRRPAWEFSRPLSRIIMQSHKSAVCSSPPELRDPR
jgi:hypothetical protein